MPTYTLSFQLRTDLDPSQLLDLLHATCGTFVEEVESYGGEVEDPDLVDVTACVEEN
jgi:hypothetical protein